MDGGRAEAERWLTAAEKLLTNRDFHGCKSFAIRARETDPRLEATDRLLAVVDTLIAGECLINGQQPDWYGILQLGHLTHSVDLIADHYRRLALLLNPERNPFLFSDQAFRLVSEAWSVLSNPDKKAYYDNELRMIQFGHIGFQQPPPKEPHRTNVPNPPPPPLAQAPEERPLVFANDSEPPRPPARRGRPPGSKSSSSAAAAQNAESSTDPGSFWTTCPYCYMLFEYPRVYEECALKCQECDRSFQAVEVAPPPVTSKDTFYNCWAYFPLGFTGNDKGPDDGITWRPMSTMFIPPPPKVKKRKPVPAPRVYYDDDDVYVEVSDPSDDSNDSDWNEPPGGSTSTPKRKRGRPPKAKNPSKNGATDDAPAEKGPENGEQVHPEQRSASGVENVGVRYAGKPMEQAELSRGGPGISTRKQTGRGAKSLGKLDLNVECSNETEEPSRAVGGGTGRGHGVDDNIEGTGFFEGLDEFLSSLPILSVVNDDKVKAA